MHFELIRNILSLSLYFCDGYCLHSFCQNYPQKVLQNTVNLKWTSDFTNCRGTFNSAVCSDVPRFYQENWSEIEKSLDKTGIGMSGAEIVVHLRYIYFCNCPLKCIADMGKCLVTRPRIFENVRSQALAIYRLSQLRSFE